MNENFGHIGKLSAGGREFIMQSLFSEHDWKKHMSVNVDSGLWQCFKTGRSGNFVRLYAEAENIPYFRAQRDLIIRNFEFLGEELPELDRSDNKLELDTSKLIPITVTSGLSEDQKVLDAWNFLFGRKLFNLEIEEGETPFYLCTEGKFADRIIIPFKDDKTVFYFQARALYNQSPKYLNPSTDIAPRPSDILYPYDETADSLVVCEGPLDAIALQLQGVNATATMKNYVSPYQAEILSTYKGKIILGYDSDKAGQRGIERFDEVRKEMRVEGFEICPPPSGYKDWNEAHIEDQDLFSWVKKMSQSYNFEYKINNQLSSV